MFQSLCQANPFSSPPCAETSCLHAPRESVRGAACVQVASRGPTFVMGDAMVLSSLQGAGVSAQKMRGHWAALGWGASGMERGPPPSLPSLLFEGVSSCDGQINLCVL